MRRANRLHARYAAVLGENELQAQSVELKALLSDEGGQRVALDQLQTFLAANKSGVGQQPHLVALPSPASPPVPAEARS